jgi:hypothetical protein
MTPQERGEQARQRSLADAGARGRQIAEARRKERGPLAPEVADKLAWLLCKPSEAP